MPSPISSTRQVRRWTLPAALLLAVGFLALMAAPASATDHHVMIEQYAYGPANLNIDQGDTVTWTNHDSVEHDVVVTSGPASFRSPMLSQGESWSHTFTTPGSYSYICSVHPEMRAAVTAAAAAPVGSHDERGADAQSDDSGPSATAAAPANVVPSASPSATPSPTTAEPTTTTSSAAGRQRRPGPVAPGGRRVDRGGGLLPAAPGLEADRRGGARRRRRVGACEAGPVSESLVWLPFEPDELGDPPAGLRYEVVDPTQHVPESVGDVRFYVTPYTFGPVADVIDRMSSLEVVQTLTAGVDYIAHRIPAGVTLCSGRGIHDASTAELAVALTLASLSGIPEFVAAQQRHEWAFQWRQALADKRVLVVGYGAIGAAIEARLTPFEVEIVRVARSARDGVHAVDELPGAAAAMPTW